MNNEKRWILTDTTKGVWEESFSLNHRDHDALNTTPWSIRKRVLRGGWSDGVDVIEVDNGELAFTIVPSRGMGLWKGRYHDCPIGWNAPVTGPVHPRFVNLLDNGGLGWLQGFDECIVRCGLSSNGAPGKDIVPDNNGNPSEVLLPLHGRIANSPATRVEVLVRGSGRQTELVVSGTVEEGMLFFPHLRLTTVITTRAGSNTVSIHDTVTNLNAVPREMQLLYHCNFGAPFLGQGSRLIAPSRRVAPRDARAAEDIRTYDRYLEPTPGFVEQCYWHEVGADASGNTLVMLKNRTGDRAVALRYNTRQLPCFAQWKNTAALEDGYVTGLEPGTNFPNRKLFERQRGRVVTLAPGQSYEVELAMEIHDSGKAVSTVEQEIERLAGGKSPQVSATPVPEWSDCG